MNDVLLVGDCREILPALGDGTIQCCVTSPPYWGLRDYGHGDQLGLEKTPEEYVAALVGVFREVRRVSRDDGTLWLNLGDSYAGSWGNQGRKPGRGTQRPVNGEMLQRFAKHAIGCDMGDDCKCGAGYAQRESHTGSWVNDHPTLKPKDLVGIPWRVAFALQADGWYLRSDVIWHKPNPMPESVTDRPTKSHEYVFLLSKSARYFYDAEAIKEPDSGQDHARTPSGNEPSLEPSGGLRNGHGGIRTVDGRNGMGRNARSVWTIPTVPFAGAHFATFPPELAARCIKAGSREGDTVLDPFGGAGTVGLVADRLGRNSVSIELNPAYAEMAKARVRSDAPLFHAEGFK